MKTISLKVHSNLEWPERDLQLLMAARLYEVGALTLSQAADSVDLSRRTFTELIGRFGVSIINYDPDDLENDLENVKAYTIPESKWFGNF